jgi:hypothetical protein
MFLSSAQAAQLQFTSITSSQLQEIVKEFSANQGHTSVSGAAPLGHLYGFEVGVLGGVTQTPDIENLVHQTSPSTNVSQIPNVAILGAVTIPLGFTFETNFLPKVGSSDLKASVFSLAAKWTLTEVVIPYLPFSLALKGHYATTELDGNTTVNNVATTMKYTSNVYGLDLLASKDLVFMEPYVSVGYMSGTGKLSTGAGDIFDPSLSTSGSASATGSGLRFMVGTEFKLALIKIGFEYQNALSTSRYLGKVSLSF